MSDAEYRAILYLEKLEDGFYDAWDAEVEAEVSLTHQKAELSEKEVRLQATNEHIKVLNRLAEEASLVALQWDAKVTIDQLHDRAARLTKKSDSLCAGIARQSEIIDNRREARIRKGQRLADEELAYDNKYGPRIQRTQ